jgi:hypothetical protein
MKVQVQAVAPTEVDADTLAVPLTEEGLAETAQAVDGALDGLLQQLLQEGGSQERPRLRPCRARGPAAG